MSEVVAGRYELGVSLGAGGMGRVVTARDRVLDRTVAVKLVPVEQARSADPALTARFVAEARTAARFTHRHVVTVYDAGESDGYLYIVTEFVDGTTLAHRLAERGALGVDESVRVGEQLLSALGAAHQAGIVHRDVKPSNVLLDANGNVKLADFGIAKRLDDLEAALTAAGEFVGTPRYVAPEQAAGQRATPATDLYAVGVVMYEMLSGEAPFHAETPIATLLAHRDAPVPDVRQTRPEVPAALAAAITTAMAKQPADRFGSAGEMRTAITNSTTSTPADPTAPATVAIPAGATAAYSSLDPLLVPPTQAFADGGDPAAMNVFGPPPPHPPSTRRPPAWAISPPRCAPSSSLLWLCRSAEAVAGERTAPSPPPRPRSLRPKLPSTQRHRTTQRHRATQRHQATTWPALR
ncbi:MAG: serine/threonine protein kinase [Acidimicrobiia bacterium]|nr:serine/threonine protein kinase [Acidimicrobiia bacterium]